MSYEDYGYNTLLGITPLPNNQITEKNNLAAVADGTINYDQTTLGTIRTKQGIQSANYIPGISGWKIFGNGAAEFQVIASKEFIHVYSQNDQPTGGTYYQGDLWYDTNDSNKRYVYKGGLWVVDTSISSWSSLIDDDGHKPDNDATFGATWNSNITGQPSDASITNPSYITSTKITSTTIESPTITAGTITGSTVQTASSGQRVVLDTNNYVSLYSSYNGGTFAGKVEGLNFGGVGQGVNVNGVSVAGLSVNNIVIAYVNSTGMAVNYDLDVSGDLTINNVIAATSGLSIGSSSSLFNGIYANAYYVGSGSNYLNFSSSKFQFNATVYCSGSFEAGQSLVANAAGAYIVCRNNYFYPQSITYKDGSGNNQTKTFLVV